MDENDLNNQNEQQNEQRQEKGGNIGYRAAESAEGVAKNAEKVSHKLGSGAGKLRQKAELKGGVRGQKLEKRAQTLEKAARKAEKVAKKAEKFSKIAVKIGKIITFLGFILLILMIIIGLIVFIVAGWGLLLSTFKEIGEKFFDFCNGIMSGRETNVKDDEIIDLIDNIQTMGYDLYGYGFVSSTSTDDKNNDIYHTNGELIEELEDKDAYRYLTTYLISDNYAYYIKNHNFNFRTMTTDAKHFFGGIFDKTNWGSGLISVYKQKGDSSEISGERGEVYGSLADKIESGAVLGAVGGSIVPGFGTVIGGLGLGLINGISSIITDWDEVTSSIKVNRNANQGRGALEISAIGLWSNQVFSYNLDGWTGRYSMPLEFLLATHIATMAPDLSYELATGFNTDVEILLYRSKENSLLGGIKIDGSIITYKDFQEKNKSIFNDKWLDWEGFDALSLSSKDAMKIFNTFPQLKSQTSGRYACKKIAPTNKPEIEKISVDDAAEAGIKDGYKVLNIPYTVDAAANEKAVSEAFAGLYDTHLANELEGCSKEEFLKFITSKKLSDFSNKDNAKENLMPYFDWEKEDGLYCREHALTGRRFWKVETIDEVDSATEELTTYNIRCATMYDEKDKEISVYLVIQKNKYKEEPNTERVLCSDRYGGKACKNCRDYLRLIYRAMASLTEDDFDIFVPYINCVTDHWFRNVYFTGKALHENKDTAIETDEDYYLSTGEMWTSYEMTPDNDYELYVFEKDENGNYSGKFKEEKEKYVICQPVPAGTGDYEFATEGENRYVKKSGGDYKLVVLNDATSNDASTRYTTYKGNLPEEFKVGKKAKTRNDIDEDWNAYDSNPDFKQASEWQEYEITEKSPDEIKALKDFADIKLVYQAGGYQVKQNEDGVRGQTRSKIKKLFLDEYYLYDGSGSRAALIEEAKNMVENTNKSLNKNDPDVFKELLGDKTITANYHGKDYTATIDQISGSINILQNSLTAFSILKNMHTLDAEYIYHDFKELIVELDYFDKEDLTQAEESVMMFPIAEISSAGWPVARYDKGEEYYGTLIHSVQDYNAKKAETIAELSRLFEMEEEEVSDIGTVSSSDIISEAVETDSLLVQAAADIMVYMQANGYAYCQGGNYHPREKNGKWITVEEAHAGRSCYRAKSFEDSKQPGHNLIDCSGFVSWCLQEVGIIPEGQLFSSATISSATALAEYYTPGHKASYSDYAPGTILIFDGHVDIYGGDGKFYDAGNTQWIQNSPNVNIPGWRDASQVKGYIYIPNEKMTYNGIKGVSANAEFSGYQGGEAVVAPVTGEVIKYGTVERNNIETGEKEDVGFIKIRVLGNEEALPGAREGCTYFDEAGYNYFWEEYMEAGINNHVLYIEGFDVSQILGTHIDTDNSVKGKNIRKLAEYIKDHNEFNYYKTAYKVPRTVDDKKMEKLLAQEAAKRQATYMVEKDGKIYVKEGAVIGYTYQQANAHTKDKEIPSYDADGNLTTTSYPVGNYMRVIFRDVGDQVVENVENYMEVDGSTSVEAGASEIEFMAGVITAEAGGTGDGLIATSWVIRNRLEKGTFGNSLAEILVAKNQFEVVSQDANALKGYLTGEVISIQVNGTTYYVTKPTEEALEVAQKVLNGELENPVEDRLFWKSADTDVDSSKEPIQIPAGTGNKFHY